MEILDMIQPKLNAFLKKWWVHLTMEILDMISAENTKRPTVKC